MPHFFPLSAVSYYNRPGGTVSTENPTNISLLPYCICIKFTFCSVFMQRKGRCALLKKNCSFGYCGRVALVALALVMLFSAFPVNRTRAVVDYAEHHVRVGLAYGSSSKNAATLQVASGTGTGFRAGYINPSTDVFTTYYNIPATKVTVIRTYGKNYNVNTGSYVSDGADSSVCVGRWHLEIQIDYDTASELDAAVSAAASASGYVCYPAFTQGGYRVRIGRFTSSDDAAEVKAKITERLNATSTFAGATLSTVSGGANGYAVLEYGTRNILFEWDGASQELALKAYGGSAPETYMATSSGTYRYYGIMDFVKTSSSSTTFGVVNVVPLGLYIRGVVPYELGMSYPDESTKAMAIIAATYAAYNEGRHSSYGFDVCTGQHCQVYRGIGTASTRYETDKVVDCCTTVDGMVITYDGEPIQAVYHSTNGGWTENSENVWVATLPYLRSVPEKFEQTTEGATRGQNGIWTNELTGYEIAVKLNRYNYVMNTVTSVKVTERSEAGSALTLTISDGTHTVNLKKENMRMVLGTDVLLSQNFKVYQEGSVYVNDGTELSSGLTDVYVMGGDGEAMLLPETARTALTASGQEVISASSSGDNVWIFDGAGWGHSLGLCQWGSIGMGRAGYTFDQIIKYYFTGVQISGFDY